MYVAFNIYLEADSTAAKSAQPNEDPKLHPEVTTSTTSSSIRLSRDRVLKKIIKEWVKEDKIFGSHCFSVDNGSRKKYTFQALKCESDEIYERLVYNGFGMPGTKTAIITNDNMYCEGHVVEKHEEEEKLKSDDLVECLKSIQSKLTVHEVLANVRAKGRMSLDSVFQVITAGMIAMTGLAMDDPVIVVASMFIAPLMDVINMITFAIRIESRSDIVIGTKTFVLYIGIMMTMALLLGKPMQEWSKMLSIFMYGESQTAYPTRQMSSRGNQFSLIGVAVLAVCSSLSSYSSMLNGYNFNVHIGNAISLSLVPPVMNFGMMLVFGIDTAVQFSGAHVNSTDPCLRAYALCDEFRTNPVFNASLASCVKTSVMVANMLKAHSLPSDKHKLCRYPQAAFFEALISLSITFLTAVIVIAMGLGLMWIKKFTPSRLDKNHVSEFYKNDLDTYVQDAHHTVRRRSTTFFINQLRSELMSKNLTESDCETAIQLAQRTQHFQTITSALGMNPNSSITHIDTETPTRRRLMSRQFTDCQRTIYDTYVPYRSSSTYETHLDSLNEKNDGFGRVGGTVSVGRFQITHPDAHSPLT